MEKQTYAQKISQQIIEALQNGTAPWQKSWSGADLAQAIPYNPVTKTKYKGINALNLMSKSFEDSRWLTFKQASDLGYKIKKGEKSTTIVYSKFYDLQDKLDEQGKKILDEFKKPIKEKILLDKPQLFYANVFNATQIDGIETLKSPTKEQYEQDKFKAIEAGEQILNTSGAKINHIFGDNAFYLPLTDSITLPLKEQFQTPMDYYSTALHELSHWSGHPSRLGRDLSGKFATPSYAKEELRAEIGSLMLCADLGVDFDPTNHYAYLGNWIKIIEEKPNEIFKASSDGEKIKDFLISFGISQDKNQDEKLTIATKLSPQQSTFGANNEAMKEKEQQNQEAKARLNQQRDERYESTAQRLSNEFENLQVPNEDHPFLKQKKILNYGIKVDKKGNIIVPFKDIEGKHWSNQVIKSDGNSYFEKRGKIGGNFALIGAENLKDISLLVIAQGYATSASIFEATKIPVVMVGDVNNLSSVTQNVFKANPNASILIASDSENMNLIKSAKVAESFNLQTVSPFFTTKEADSKATNYNDLALSRGLQRVKLQIDSAFKRVFREKPPKSIEAKTKIEAKEQQKTQSKKTMNIAF